MDWKYWVSLNGRNIPDIWSCLEAEVKFLRLYPSGEVITDRKWFSSWVYTRYSSYNMHKILCIKSVFLFFWLFYDPNKPPSV